MNQEQKNKPPSKPASPHLPSCAIVVVCHNYGEFLAEACESAIAQSQPAREIVIVDDSSADGTPEIAKQICEKYADRSVKYLRIEARNTHAARMAGLQETDSEILCFLDADDILPENYLAAGLPLFLAENKGESTGIVTSDMQQFGTQSYLMELEEGKSCEMQRGNIAHAGSLVRRAALLMADAPELRIPANASNDWLVWKPICNLGWKIKKSAALYGYRRHPESQSHVWRNIRENFYYTNSNLSAETITLFIPLSGRFQWWPRMADWLNRQGWPADQVRLVLCDTSQNPKFHSQVRDWLTHSRYGDARVYKQIISRPGLADENRREQSAQLAVRDAMPKLYNRAIRECTTEMLVIIEDDILPPLDAIDRMLRSMGRHVVSVTGAYRSRFHDGYLAWDEKNRHVPKGSGVAEVRGNGFGCVLLRKSVAERHVFHAGSPFHNYDPNFYDWVSRNPLPESGKAVPAKVLIDWSIECDHAGDLTAG